MDPFADLTALAPPSAYRNENARGAMKNSEYTNAHASAAVITDEDTGPGYSANDTSADVSGLDDSISMQYSADPTAFLGFETRKNGDGRFTESTAANGRRGDGDRKRMKLALDLGSSGKQQHDFRPQGVSISQLSQNASYSQQHFAEIFGGDTQDDVEQQLLHDSSVADAAALPGGTERHAAVVNGPAKQTERRTSPPPTLLASIEHEWAKRKETRKPPAMESGERAQSKNSNIYIIPSEEKQIATESDQSEPPVTRTITKHALDDSLSASPSVSDPDDEERRAEEQMFVETEPFFSNEEDETVSFYHRRDSMDSLPDTQSLGDDDDIDDFAEREENAEMQDAGARRVNPHVDRRVEEIQSRDSSVSNKSIQETPLGAATRAAAANYVTPDQPISAIAEENTARVLDVPKTTGKKMGIVKNHQTERNKATALPPRNPEEIIRLDEDSDDEDEPPTQPSASKDTSAACLTSPCKSTNTLSNSRNTLKKREKTGPDALATLTDSEEMSYEFMDSACKCGNSVCRCSPVFVSAAKSSTAMRNLEFAFAMPDSQETQSEMLDSVPDVGKLASKALHAQSDADKKQVVSKTSTPLLPPSLPKTASSAMATSRKSEQASVAKRESPTKTPSSVMKKKSKTSSEQSTPTKGASSVESPPTARKRKRAFVSPDAGMRSISTPGDDDRTPLRRSTRRNSSSSATSSASSVRTRAKYLSPLPSNRAYVSRTKTIFKYKFEFCLTGFMKDGEVNLTELIEEHGGKIPERYQDVLHKNNPKAVVIATPVSWRKLKFIYAIACGIPVVHPEWIHACVTAGQVVPFDGYFIPSGYSFTTRKFECLTIQQLDIFAGLSFGIPYDVVRTSSTSSKSMGSLMSFVLKACGAKHVVETCEYYRKKHKTPLRTFPWVTECMILQRFIKKSKEDLFQPRVYERDNESQASEETHAVNAEIGDADRDSSAPRICVRSTMLKLHTGELVLADLSGNGIDHFLLFHVCEILRIIIHREEEQNVSLEVGVLKRSPNSPGLSRTHSKVLQIPALHVKRRVVAVSATDFQQLEYRDENIFYYEEKGERDDSAKAKCVAWL
ncbi:hypothetical protein FI667_g6615, partial [Globisporangium splendens]